MKKSYVGKKIRDQIAGLLYFVFFMISEIPKFIPVKLYSPTQEVVSNVSLRTICSFGTIVRGIFCYWYDYFHVG